MANKFGQIFRQAPNPQYQRLDLGLYRDALAQTRARYDVTQDTLSTLDRGMSQIDVGDNEQAKQLLAERTGIIHQGIDKLLAQGNLEDLTLQSQQLANQFLRDEDVKTLLRSKQEYDAQRAYALKNPGKVIDFNRYKDHQFIGVDENGNRVINQYVADNEQKLDWGGRKLQLAQAQIDDDTVSGWATPEEKAALIKITKGQSTGLTKAEETALLNKVADFYMTSTDEGRQQLRALTTANSLNQFNEEAILTEEQARERIKGEFYNLEGTIRDKKTVYDVNYTKNHNYNAGGTAQPGAANSPYVQNMYNPLMYRGTANMDPRTGKLIFGEKTSTDNFLLNFGKDDRDPTAAGRWQAFADVRRLEDATGMPVVDVLKAWNKLGAEGQKEFEDDFGKFVQIATSASLGRRDKPYAPAVLEIIEDIQNKTIHSDAVVQGRMDADAWKDMTDKLQTLLPTMTPEEWVKLNEEMAATDNSEAKMKLATGLVNVSGQFTLSQGSGDNTQLVDEGKGYNNNSAFTKGAMVLNRSTLLSIMDNDTKAIEALEKEGVIRKKKEEGTQEAVYEVYGYMGFDPASTQNQMNYDQQYFGKGAESGALVMGLGQAFQQRVAEDKQMMDGIQVARRNNLMSGRNIYTYAEDTLNVSEESAYQAALGYVEAKGLSNQEVLNVVRQTLDQAIMYNLRQLSMVKEDETVTKEAARDSFSKMYVPMLKKALEQMSSNKGV